MSPGSVATFPEPYTLDSKVQVCQQSEASALQELQGLEPKSPRWNAAPRFFLSQGLGFKVRVQSFALASSYSIRQTCLCEIYRVVL